MTDAPSIDTALNAPARRALPGRVVVVHGFGATPDDHWFPWLRAELRSDGVAAAALTLPRPLAPDPRTWHDVLAGDLGVPDESTWIVAHSLGVVTALRVLAGLPGSWHLGGLVLVSGFTGPLGALPELDPYLSDDIADGELARIRARTRTITALRSDDDAIVPAAATDLLAHRLGVRPVVVPGAGHFLAEDGVTRLALVLDLVRGAVTG